VQYNLPHGLAVTFIEIFGGKTAIDDQHKDRPFSVQAESFSPLERKKITAILNG
jgi:hypothetical protein